VCHVRWLHNRQLVIFFAMVLMFAIFLVAVDPATADVLGQTAPSHPQEDYLPAPVIERPPISYPEADEYEQTNKATILSFNVPSKSGISRPEAAEITLERPVFGRFEAFRWIATMIFMVLITVMVYMSRLRFGFLFEYSRLIKNKRPAVNQITAATQHAFTVGHPSIAVISAPQLRRGCSRRRANSPYFARRNPPRTTHVTKCIKRQEVGSSRHFDTLVISP
jgi:hypothetical protein